MTHCTMSERSDHRATSRSSGQLDAGEYIFYLLKIGIGRGGRPLYPLLSHYQLINRSDSQESCSMCPGECV